MTVQTEYTPIERDRMIRKMKLASDEFYRHAVEIGFHQFIEFAGFMNEFIKSCEKMHTQGVDFATAALDVEPHNAAYVGEKMGCIYGPTLSRPANMKAFLKGLEKD